MADDIDEYIPGRIRVAPIFPHRHVTGEQIAQFHVTLTARGVTEDLYRIEAVVVFDKRVKDQVVEASYDIEPLTMSGSRLMGH